MTTQTLTELCALQEHQYYQGCLRCSGTDKTKICYTGYEDLQKHLTDLRNMFSPMIQRFYQRYGNRWREQARSLKGGYNER